MDPFFQFRGLGIDRRNSTYEAHQVPPVREGADQAAQGLAQDGHEQRRGRLCEAVRASRVHGWERERQAAVVLHARDGAGVVHVVPELEPRAALV
jgi:hypothetical protein